LIWELAKKYRIRLGRKKYRFCRTCFTWWTADSLRVRLVHDPYPAVLYRCLRCGREYRFPISVKKSN